MELEKATEIRHYPQAPLTSLEANSTLNVLLPSSLRKWYILAVLQVASQVIILQNELQIPSGKEVLILRLLRESHTPMFGLELVQNSDGELRRGTVYVTLQRMEEKGFVRSQQEPRPQPQIGIPRRRYSITGLGERALSAYDAAHAVFSMEPAFSGGL